MTLSKSALIGRITDPATLANVAGLSLTATELTASGRVAIDGTVDPTHARFEALKAARDQVIGLGENPDESIVPFVHTGDTSLSQMVRVRSTSAEIEAGGIEIGRTPWTFNADRIISGQLPRIETQVDGTTRTNDQTVIAVDLMPWHAVSSKATGYTFSGLATTPVVRTGPGGSVNFYRSAQSYLNGYPQWTIAPADYYDMAATFKIGSVLRPVIGRKFDAANNLTAWEIGNGLFKIGPGTSGNALLAFTMPVSGTPTSWGTPYQIEAGFYAAAWFPQAAAAIRNISILRNGPELVIIRLWVSFAPSGGTTSSAFTLDLAVRRGSRGANVVIKSPSSKQWGLSYATAPAGGTADVSIRAHAAGLNRVNNDADTNRLALFTAAPNLRDNVNGRLYDDAGVTSIDMGIYGEVGGSGTASPENVDSLLIQYMSAQTESRATVLP